MSSDSSLVYLNSSLVESEKSNSHESRRRMVNRVVASNNAFDQDEPLNSIDDLTCVHSSGGVCAPIIDFETVERKQTFTVYRIHVVTLSKNWYIFRRYTDFSRLNEKLTKVFPGFHAKLPAKRWLGNNYDPDFLKSRKRGLQLYMNTLMRHDLIARSTPLKEFLCLDDPPGPYDSIEESRAYCEEMEKVVNRDKNRTCELETELHATKSRLAQAQIQQEVLAAALKSERFKNAKLRQHHLTTGESRSKSNVNLSTKDDSTNSNVDEDNQINDNPPVINNHIS